MSKEIIISLIGIWGAIFLSSNGNAQQRTTISIVQTADIHGQLFPHQEFFLEEGLPVFKERGGIAHIQTIFKNIKADNPEGTIILDGGDLIQGSALTALSKGEVLSPVIQAMDYDLLIPGNWEVVYGGKQMRKVLQSFDKKILSANMYDSLENPLFAPYHIQTVKGVKIGFLAYNDPEVPVRQNPTFSKGLIFKPVEDNIKSLIREMKEEKKVDVLFLVTHLGISKQIHLSNQKYIKGVDFILGNDTHERIRQPLKGKYAQVLEPGAFASFVGRLDITVEDGKLVNQQYELIEVDPEKYPADPTIEHILTEQIAPFKDQVNRVLGYTETPLYRYLVVENPMDNMITDAVRWKTGVDIAISNGFRFSPPIVPDSTGKAPITYGDIWNMIPVNEKAKTGLATGKQIKDWMEQELHNVFSKDLTERFGGWLVRFSGMELTFKAHAPKGKRVVSIKVKGEDLDLKKEYSVAACLRAGESDNTLCRMSGIKKPEIKDYTVHEVLEEYLQKHKTVSPGLDGRAKALDLDSPVLSQLPGTDYHFH